MKKIICGILATGISFSVSAIEMKREVKIAYDSNPFRFSDIYDKDSAAFLSLKARLKQTWKDDSIYLKGRVKSVFYESSADDANEMKVRATLGHLDSFKYSKQRFTHRLEAYYGFRDKTYVSQLSGGLATFNNQTIGDRYDYRQGGLRAKISTKVREKLKAGVSLEYRDRNYENYSITGLSDLDYSAIELSNSWDYSISKRRKVGAEFSYTRQDFKDHRTKDISGTSLAGSDLSYNIYDLVLDYKFHPASYTDVKMSYDLSYRKDNGGGYYNTRSHIAKLGADYRLFKWAYIESLFTYRNTSYLQEPDPNDVANDEELTNKEGYSLRLSYRQSLKKLTGYKLYAGFSLQQDDIGSDNKFYDYDRQRVTINLKGEI